MTTRSLALVLVAAIAACGGPATPRAPIDDRGGGAAPNDVDDPEAVLRALAAAARGDDGVALDALIHPVHGLVLWDQPGARLSPALTWKAGKGAKPSVGLQATGMNDYWKEHYWARVADGIDASLARLDLEPADRNAPIYGTCEDESATGLRAWLALHDEVTRYYDLFEENPPVLEPVTTRDLVHLHAWGLDLWLARDRGRLWVAHVMVWTPCDA